MMVNLLDFSLSPIGTLFPTDPFPAPLAISLGAIPGALSRYYLTVLLTRRLGTRFPYGTFFINLSGSLLIGFFATLGLDHPVLPPSLQLLITTGFLGSYTTFSTYAIETINLNRAGRRSIAWFYWAGSILLGGLCLAIGMVLAHTLA